MKPRAKPSELERFRKLVQGMSRDSAVYRMLKQELSALGYWKNKPRGKPIGFKSLAEEPSHKAQVEVVRDYLENTL